MFLDHSNKDKTDIVLVNYLEIMVIIAFDIWNKNSVKILDTR